MPSTAGRSQDYFYIPALYSGNQQSWSQENSVMHYIMPSTLKTIQFVQHTLVDLLVHAFHTAYACYKCMGFWQKNYFADSSIVRVKNTKISSCRWWHFRTATFAIKGLQHRVTSFLRCGIQTKQEKSSTKWNTWKIAENNIFALKMKNIQENQSF